jgi:hypothetical protein
LVDKNSTRRFPTMSVAEPELLPVPAALITRSPSRSCSPPICAPLPDPRLPSFSPHTRTNLSESFLKKIVVYIQQNVKFSALKTVVTVPNLESVLSLTYHSVLTGDGESDIRRGLANPPYKSNYTDRQY